MLVFRIDTDTDFVHKWVPYLGYKILRDLPMRILQIEQGSH